MLLTACCTHPNINHKPKIKKNRQRKILVYSRCISHNEIIFLVDVWNDWIYSTDDIHLLALASYHDMPVLNLLENLHCPIQVDKLIMLCLDNLNKGLVRTYTNWCSRYAHNHRFRWWFWHCLFIIIIDSSANQDSSSLDFFFALQAPLDV